MTSQPLYRFMSTHREEIYRSLCNSLEDLQPSPYQEMLRTEKGRHRLKNWLDLIVEAVGGGSTTFIEDQKKIGYLRAIQGYTFDDVGLVYLNTLKEFWQELEESVNAEGAADLAFYHDMRNLYDLVFKGFQTVAASFLQTREEKILEKISQLKVLTGKVITIQEDERKNLAADIHDTVAQALSGVNFKLQYCLELSKINDQTLPSELEQLSKTIDNTIIQTRELMSSLRPELIDSFGLIAALKQHMKAFAETSGIAISFDLPENVDIQSEKSICLFRVVQEALMNIYKHTDEKSTHIYLRQTSGEIVLTINDSGPGFQMRAAEELKRGIGLILMQERIDAVGGVLLIESGQNQGCKITARVPTDRR